MMRAGIDYYIKGSRAYGPVVLPPSIYDLAAAQGIDMRDYIRQERVPLMPPGNQDKPKPHLK